MNVTISMIYGEQIFRILYHVDLKKKNYINTHLKLHNNNSIMSYSIWLIPQNFSSWLSIYGLLFWMTKIAFMFFHVSSQIEKWTYK